MTLAAFVVVMLLSVVYLRSYAATATPTLEPLVGRIDTLSGFIGALSVILGSMALLVRLVLISGFLASPLSFLLQLLCYLLIAVRGFSEDTGLLDEPGASLFGESLWERLREFLAQVSTGPLIPGIMLLSAVLALLIQ